MIDFLNDQHLEGVSWQLALVVKHILNLGSLVDHISFLHIPCEWNKVVDCLAKWASEGLDKWDIENW